MLASAIVVFREVLEAALIVGIVLAATRGIVGRGRWVLAGIAAGIAGAVLAAAFATSISELMSGMGQEAFNAGILFLAVVMLGWHNVWMSRHGRAMARDMKAVGSAVAAGERPLYVLAIVVGLAVLREGSEVVLFLYGIAASGGSALQLVSGSLLGVVLGMIAGAALYLGLLRIPTGKLFTVTGWMILLLAAGMAAQGAGFLVQAGVLPPLGDSLWDTSNILSERSLVGQVLHTLIGYIAQPAGVQVAFYAATVLVIGVLMRLYGREEAMRKAAGIAAGIVALGAAVGVDADRAHAADDYIRYPTVVERELEFEQRGAVDFDSDPGRNHHQNYKAAIGYGITDFWRAEIEGEFNKEPGRKLNYETTGIENIVRVLPEGKYWLDLGLFAEYEIAADKNDPDELHFGPIFQKAVGPILVTFNPFFAHEIGSHAAASMEFEYGAQFRYQWHEQFEPGIEVFGRPGEIRGFGRVSDQEHKAGPVAYGRFGFGRYGALKYEAGVLFGLTHNSPSETIKWLVEYEFFL
jgi:high-affinity iron transporter